MRFFSNLPIPTCILLLGLTLVSSQNEDTNDDKPLNLDPIKSVKSRSCVNKNGEPGFCVPYYLCKQNNGTIIKDGADILDMRTLQCPNYLETCCKNESTVILSGNTVDTKTQGGSPGEIKLNSRSCVNNNGEPGFCVPYYLCKQNNGTIIKDGADILDMRTIQCPNYLETCCKNESTVILSGNTVDTKTQGSSPGEIKLKSRSCVNNNGEPGFCVPYYLCKQNNGTIIKDGADILDMRTVSCPKYMETCCKNESMVQESSYRFSVGKLSGRTEDMDTRAGSAAEIKPQNTDCGWSNPMLDPNQTKKAGEAGFGEFPWIVAVVKKQMTQWTTDNYICSGSIIHPAVVITIAHKVQNLTDDIKCRAGEWNVQTQMEKYPHQEKDVSRIMIHPEFYRTSLYNDVALLILNRPFEFEDAPHIGVGCLANGWPEFDTPCYSMGWGKNKNKVYATTLKKVPMNLVQDKTCESILQKERLGEYFRLHHSLTCAGGGDNDMCTGDGGAPLVCEFETSGSLSRYAIFGMVSYGLGCHRNVPGVYADIPDLFTWISNTMKKENFGNIELVIEN